MNEISPLKALGYAVTFTMALNTALVFAVNNMYTQIEEKTHDRYTSQDAERDFKLRDFRLQLLDQRVDECFVFTRQHDREGK